MFSFVNHVTSSREIMNVKILLNGSDLPEAGRIIQYHEQLLEHRAKRKAGAKVSV